MSRQYGPEQKLVIDTFQKCFDLHKQYPIVLYGTGKNTEAVLSGTKGFPDGSGGDRRDGIQSESFK